MKSYSEQIYQMIYKSYLNDSLKENLNQIQLNKINKVSQKIILSVQKNISTNFPQVMLNWKSKNKKDPNGYDLARNFLQSEEFDQVKNISFTDNCNDFNTQFKKFVKNTNKRNIHKQMVIQNASEIDLTEKQLQKAIDLINNSYKDAEKDLWKPTKQRITKDKLVELMNKRMLWIVSFKNHIIGTLKLTYLDQNRAEFGLFCIDPAFRGYNIGQALIERAEKETLNSGRKTMELEIFLPKNLILSCRERLKNWYKAQNYYFEKKVNCSHIDPGLREMAAIPLSVERWTKILK